MIDQEFEGPWFKVLSKNDSGKSEGNQAGFLINKGLRGILPILPEPSTSQPVPSVSLNAILMLNNDLPKLATVNYKNQTRSGKRSGETRITGNLKSIRDLSKAGDILLIERSRADRSLIRLTVATNGSDLYGQLIARTGGKDLGVLEGSIPVLSDTDVEECSKEIQNLSDGAFNLFDESLYKLTLRKQLARAAAFRKAVVSAYGDKCAMCGRNAKDPHGMSEIEAAHVVPRSMKGCDDIRNGIALCRLHHWAFDRHLIGLTMSGNLRVHPSVKAIAENHEISILDTRPFLQPLDPTKRIKSEALEFSMASFESHWSLTL